MTDMSNKPKQTQAAFFLATTWVPRAEVKWIEKSLAKELRRLIGLNKAAPRLKITSASETKD